jgi:hypothetical protein
MEPRRRREIVLALVVVLLAAGAVVAYRMLSAPAGPSAAGTVGSNNQDSRGPRRSPAAARPESPARESEAAQEAPQVHLEALDGDRPEPRSDAPRDIFRFRVKPPPPPPPPPRPVVGPNLPPPPPPPPPIAPIALKFIGVIDMPPPGKRVAVLSDGRGSPVYGHEGETVLGQYRILRIGAESVEMAYLDGRGRQTIRLSGS